MTDEVGPCTGCVNESDKDCVHRKDIGADGFCHTYELLIPDSPYYRWALELVEVMTKYSFHKAMPILVAKKLEDDLGDWLDRLDWCVNHGQ